MQRAVEAERPDRVFHLGDMTDDGEKLQALYPKLPMEQVRGNCDGWGEDPPEEKLVLLGGKKLWLLHGHTYRVKVGIGLLEMAAREKEVDGVFFGHTHEPLCYLNGSVWVVNPGTIRGFPQATYTVVDIVDGKMNCRMVEIK